MSARNVAYINARSFAVGTSATQLPQGANFLLLANTTTALIYVETGLSTVTSTSQKGFVNAGSTQVFRIDPTNTHAIASAVGLIAQVVEGV